MSRAAEKSIVMAALAAGALLLVAPVVPPQGAVFGFVALVLLGGSILFGYRAIAFQLSRIADAESAGEQSDPIEAVRQQYVEGDLTEREFEARLEDHEEALAER